MDLGLKKVVDDGNGNTLLYTALIAAALANTLPTPFDSIYFRRMNTLQRRYDKDEITPEKLEWIALNAPEYKEASFKVPHNGYAGTGANYITMLSQYKGKLTKTLKKTATVTPKPIAAETVLTEVAATETVTVQEPELTYA